MSSGSVLYPSLPRSFRVGGAIRPKTDLKRFVRWPKYVQVQKQKRVLEQRLKVPPSVEQFNNSATEAIKLFSNYRPQSHKEKRAELKSLAVAKAEGKKVVAPKHRETIISGINEVTKAIEQKKAKLVLIAHDVDPLELVLYLPALCSKMEVPYAIINNKARLGSLCHFKTASCLAITSVNKEDEAKLNQLATSCKEHSSKHGHKWGGGILGLKTQQKLRKREEALKAEVSKSKRM